MSITNYILLTFHFILLKMQTIIYLFRKLFSDTIFFQKINECNIISNLFDIFCFANNFVLLEIIV